MRLTSDVHLVGGGTLSGFGVSSDFDAHCYLVDGGDEQILVECGMGTETGFRRVTGNIRRAGYDPAAITTLFLTHYHTDHAGGASVYREHLGLSVATGTATGRVLEAGDHEATSFCRAQAAGVFPEDYSYEACPVDDLLPDGTQRSVGRLTEAAALAVPYPSFFEDPAIQAAYPDYYDLGVITSEYDRAGTPAARALSWYQGFQVKVGERVNDMLAGDATPAETVANMADDAVELAAG